MTPTEHGVSRAALCVARLMTWAEPPPGSWLNDHDLVMAMATSSGRMAVQKQTFVQPVSNRIPVPTTITNVIATLKGTASPERFYVVTGHLDSRVTDVLDFTSDAPGADDDASGVA